MPSTDDVPVALITGAASGMGLALTRQLVAKGWRVAMCDLNAEQGTKHSEALNDEPHQSLQGSLDRTMFRCVDITSYTQQASFFKEAFDWGGGHIDYFAANAGIMDVTSLLQPVKQMELDPTTNLPLPLSTKTIDINLRAVVEGIWLYRFFHAQTQQNFLPDKPRRGRITMTASCAGLYPIPGWAQYTASKHALIGLVRSTYTGLRQESISINAICPSFVLTGMTTGFEDIWPKEYLVPMSSVLKAHDTLINDDWGMYRAVESDVVGKKKSLNGMMTGQALELSQEEMCFRKQVGYCNEGARWVTEDSGEFIRAILAQRAEAEEKRDRTGKL